MINSLSTFQFNENATKGKLFLQVPACTQLPGMLCSPAQLFGNPLYLFDECIIRAGGFDVRVAAGCPAVDLLDGTVAAPERSGKAQAVFFRGRFGENDTQLVVLPGIAFVVFVPTLLRFPFTNGLCPYGHTTN